MDRRFLCLNWLLFALHRLDISALLIRAHLLRQRNRLLDHRLAQLPLQIVTVFLFHLRLIFLMHFLRLLLLVRRFLLARLFCRVCIVSLAAALIMHLSLSFLLMLFGLSLRRLTHLFKLLYRLGLCLNSVRFAHGIRRFLTWLTLLSQFLIWLLFTLALLRLPPLLRLLLLQSSRPLHFSPLVFEHFIDAFLQKFLFLLD